MQLIPLTFDVSWTLKLFYFYIQEPLPFSCPRTPKHLAPLDQQYRDGHVLSNLQHPLTPRLTSLLSFGSKETSDTFSRLSSRGSGGTGRGSEGSSYSSQSSLDEAEDEEEDEEEEDKNSPQETGEMFRTIQKEPNIASVSRSSAQQLLNSGITEHILSDKTMPTKSKYMRRQKLEAPFERTLDSQISEARDVFEENITIYSADVSKKNKSVELVGGLSNEPDEPKDTVTDSRPVPGDGQSSSFVDTQQKHAPPVNIPLHPAPAEISKDHKTTRAEKIKSKSSHTNQTINTLDQFNIRRDNGKPKRNRKTQSPQAMNKEADLIGNVIGEESGNKSDRPKVAPTKHGPKLKDAPLNRRRTPESVHQGRLSGTKKISNKPQSQKQLQPWETKKTVRQSKRPGSLGTQRTKSSLDYVSYRDMFVEIRQADEGPAIFEMFATPIYENLRAGSSVDRAKQVQSAPHSKRQPGGRNRAQKPVEGNRRKQKCTPAKGKQRKRKELQPPEPQSHDQAIDSNKNNASGTGTEEPDKAQIRKHKLLTTEENEGQRSDSRLQAERSHVLSMIGEVPSETDTRIDFQDQQGALSSSFQSHGTPYLGMQFSQLKDHNNNKGVVISNEVEDAVAVQLPLQPLINTWTTDRTKSPVYQSFLDEVGDGPVTDDLLKRLAEELISLEEREVETLKPENLEMINGTPSKFKEIFSEVRQSKQL